MNIHHFILYRLAMLSICYLYCLSKRRDVWLLQF